MKANHTVQTLRSYRAHLVPPGIDPADAQDLADAQLLPTIRVKAANATQAEAFAHMATGRHVMHIERMEG